MPPAIDVGRIVLDLGGKTDLARALTAKGQFIDPIAIHRWVQRNRIPSRYLAALAEIYRERHGTPLDFSTYVEQVA